MPIHVSGGSPGHPGGCWDSDDADKEPTSKQDSDYDHRTQNQADCDRIDINRV